MILLIIMILLLLGGFVLGFKKTNNAKQLAILISILAVVYLVLMPLGLSQIFVNSIKIIMGGPLAAGKVLIAFVIYFILTGLLLGTGLKMGLSIKQPDKPTSQVILAIGGIIVATTNVLWMLLTVYKWISIMTGSFSGLPALYPVKFWAIITVILLVIKANKVDPLMPNLPIKLSNNSNQTREADVIRYKDDLDQLLNNVIDRTIKPNRFEQIICDVALEEYQQNNQNK